MHIALRFLLLTGAAVSAGVIINFTLLYLFRNQDLQDQMGALKHLSNKLRDPLKDQNMEYADLHHAVSCLEHHENSPHERTCEVDSPPSQ